MKICALMVALVPASADRLEATDGQVPFAMEIDGARLDVHRDAEGRITGLVMSANRAWGLAFERSGGS